MIDQHERLRRWRLVIGNHSSTGALSAGEGGGRFDDPRDNQMECLLDAIYEGGAGSGLGQSPPRLLRWLRDLRQLFPDSTRRMLVDDAVEILGPQRFAEDPRLIDEVEADPALVRALVRHTANLPVERRDAARQIIRRVVDRALDRLRLPIEQVLRLHLDRSRPAHPRRCAEIDWHRTIRANLRNYQPEWRTVIPARLIGRSVRRARRTIIICVDSSESMTRSAFHAAVIATIIAAIPSFRTHLVSFDTRVVDLTNLLSDPVEILYHLNLGGGTDIGKALAFCRTLTDQTPDQRAGTIMFLISDLGDRHDGSRLLETVDGIVNDGVRFVPVVALDDTGKAQYDAAVAAQLAARGLDPIVASPEDFPDLLLATLEPGDRPAVNVQFTGPYWRDGYNL